MLLTSYLTTCSYSIHFIATNITINYIHFCFLLKCIKHVWPINFMGDIIYIKSILYSILY